MRVRYNINVDIEVTLEDDERDSDVASMMENDIRSTLDEYGYAECTTTYETQE